MANKPHHGMRGLMHMHADAPMPKMPLRHKSGGDRKAKTSATARNGEHTGPLPGGDTRRRKGAEGNGKGSPPTNLKSGTPASAESHKGTAGRGGAGTTNQTHANRMTESMSSSEFEKLGCC